MLLNISQSHSRSLKIIRNDTLEWVRLVCKSLLVFHCEYMFVSCTISEIFIVKLWHDLEIWVTGRSRSFKVIENGAFDRPYTTSYWSSIVSIALSCTIFDEIKKTALVAQNLKYHQLYIDGR